MALKPELLGETLTRHYRLSCELFNTYPQAHYTHQLSQGSLDLHLHNIDLDHLEALCHTIKNKVSPSSLRITVPTTKKAYPMMARVVERAVEGVGVCMVASLTLTLVTFDGVKLRGRNLKMLCEGLRRARSVKTLIMRNCGLGDSGTENVCQAVKNVPSITHLSLINCGMGERGAISVACLIKHQRLNRDSAMWQDTLRQRHPHLDGMKGLRRLTLNSNPALGDQGAAAIAEALTEDLWIKAIDLQHCGVGMEGGALFHTLLHTNQSLEVVDLRNNPFLPDNVVIEVIRLLQSRSSEGSSQYSWLRTSEVEEENVENDHKERVTVGYKASGRVMKGRRGRQLSHVSTNRRPKLPSQLGVPWRVEHRLYERREGLTPGSMVKECIKEWESVGEVSQPSKEPSVAVGEIKMKKMRKKLQMYKKKYQRERERRKKLEHKLSRIQKQLKGLHTLDEHTVSHIEECFLKFHIFLSMMQNSGELQPSSPDAKSPSHHPGNSQPHPSNTFHSGTFNSLLPSSTPIPATHQPLNASTSHAFTIPELRDSNEENNVMAEIVYEPRMSDGKDETINQKLFRLERNLRVASQSQSDESEKEGKDDSSVVEIMGSDQDLKSPKDRQENQKERIEDTSNKSDQRIDDRMKVKIASHQNLYLSGYTKDRQESQKHKERMEDASSNHNQVIDDRMKAKITSHQNLYLSGYTKNQKEIKRDQERMEDVSSNHDQVIDEGMKAKIKRNKQQKEIWGSKGNDHAKIPVKEHQSPSNTDSIAMRVEFKEDEGKGLSQWNGGINVLTDVVNGRKSQPVSEGDKLERITSSKELRTIKTEKTHTQQMLTEGNRYREMSVNVVPPSEASQEPDTSQSPIRSQSLVTSQSCSTQSPSQFLKESQVCKPGPSSSSHSPQEDPLISNPKPLESQSNHNFTYQESQSPLGQSVSVQSTPSQSPQESHSPQRLQSPRKVKSPQNYRSSEKNHLVQRGNLSQGIKSPHRYSPRKSRSPRNDPPGTQGSEVSETDDEKMRNLSAWLQGRTKGRASTPSSSSVSISEHLQQSHSSWTKQERMEAAREEGEVEELPGGSEIDLSDLEDLSFSGITLTNTSVPEDINTPGEEDF